MTAPVLWQDLRRFTAARVALGPDLPALFTRRDDTAQALQESGLAHDDPCWRLPLHDAYREWLKSDIADLNNAPANGFAVRGKKAGVRIYLALCPKRIFFCSSVMGLRSSAPSS